jgi:hypothetical protein
MKKKLARAGAGNAAAVRVIWGATGNRDRADSGRVRNNGAGLCGVCGGGRACEDEGDYEGANNVFHVGYSRMIFVLDLPDKTTLGCNLG